MLRICQVTPINLNMILKKSCFILAPFIPWGNILNVEQSKILDHMNDLHGDSYLLYMVTYVMHIAGCFVLVHEADSSFCCCSLFKV
jgi:hypothetical protein